jgi:hypothetical protein
MADLALRPLSLGEQLDRAFTVYRDRFGAIVISAVICMAVPILMFAGKFGRLMEFAQASQGGATPEESMRLMFTLFGDMFIIGLIALAGFAIARTTLAWITHKALLGDRIGPIEGLEKGFRFFLPMLGLIIVEGVIYFLAMMVLYIPMVVLLAGSIASGSAAGAAGAGLAIFGWMFVIGAAMLWLVAALFVTSAVLVAESDSTVFRSIERSWTLTKGRRLGIIGGMLVVIILSFILQFGMAFGIGIVAGASGAESAGGMMIFFFALNALANLLVTGYYYVFQMVVYYDLRVRKEGLDLELASEAMASA